METNLELMNTKNDLVQAEIQINQLISHLNEANVTIAY